MNNYYSPSDQGYMQGGQQPQSLDAKVSAVMKLVYVKMFLALLVSAAAAWGVPTLFPNLANTLATNSWVYWGLAIAELALVFFISARMNK